jgi:hypothetical protein
MYELLPRYPAIEAGAGHLYPYQLPQASPGFSSKAKQAYDRHLELDRACREAAAESRESEFLAFYSSGHATASCARLVDRGVAVTEEDPDWLPTAGWEGGDGTVPAISATPEERNATNERMWAPQHHLKLPAEKQIVRRLAQFEQASLSSVRGEPVPTGPWIGLAYDEVVAAGDSSSLGFRLNGAEPSEGILPSATLKLAADRAVQLDVVARAEGDWQATLPGLSPGSYEFTVALDHVEAVDRVETTSVVGVIEP